MTAMTSSLAGESLSKHDIDELSGARAELLCFLVALAAAQIVGERIVEGDLAHPEL
jgi:hypothetical protein